MGAVILTFAQFTVHGKTDDYFLNYDEEVGWYCGCPDHHFRKRECKHIKEAKRSVRSLLREQSQNPNQSKLVVDDE